MNVACFRSANAFGPDQEAELFKSVPSPEKLDYFLHLDYRFIIMVIRGIGEMESDRTGISC
jgi:hypothetical protein